MPLPKRPGPYLLALLLIILAVTIIWEFKALSSPEIQQTLQSKKQVVPASQAARSAQPSARPEPVYIDPVNLAQASLLNSPERTPSEDLQIVAEFVNLYRKALGSNPIGQNEDITAALTGDFGRKGRVFPPNSPAIRDGQLVDRWGTPYWFHPESGTKMEIRSAGPDKELFTSDDVILKP